MPLCGSCALSRHHTNRIRTSNSTTGSPDMPQTCSGHSLMLCLSQQMWGHAAGIYDMHRLPTRRQHLSTTRPLTHLRPAPPTAVRRRRVLRPQWWQRSRQQRPPSWLRLRPHQRQWRRQPSWQSQLQLQSRRQLAWQPSRQRPPRPRCSARPRRRRRPVGGAAGSQRCVQGCWIAWAQQPDKRSALVAAHAACCSAALLGRGAV